MKVYALLVVAVGLLLAAAPEDAIPKEKKRLNGTWSVVGVPPHWRSKDWDSLSKEEQEKQLQGLQVVIKDENAWVTVAGDFQGAAVVKIDATKKPKTLDLCVATHEGFTKDGEPDNVKTTGKECYRCIYELEGDILKLCLGNPQTGERPTKIPAAPADGLYVLKRAAP